MTTADQTALPSEAGKPAPAGAAPVAGTPEYNAAMAAKFDQSTSQAPARLEHIPEKFWDAEKGAVRTDELLKSYAELEKTRGQAPAAPAPAAPAAPATPAAANPEAAAASEALASKGLDMNAFSTEFAQNGALSDQSYEALQKSGIPRAMVDAYIEGQRAIQQSQDAAGYEVAGGKENFERMAAWAATALPVADRIAFNEAVKGSPEQQRLALLGLRSQYEAANGRTPTLAGGTPAQSAMGYESKAQMTADMKDPRYTKDPAFRAKVHSKLASTTAF